MPPRWNEYRKVIDRNGFTLVRSAKHETWVLRDEEGSVIAHTTVSHGNGQIRDKAFFRALLKQCRKTEEHFYDVLRRKDR
jgi:hypothetical protein